MTAKIAVDAVALRQVLQALIGPWHHIRELQATRSLHALGHPNPIETLMEDYGRHLAEQAKVELETGPTPNEHYPFPKVKP